MLVVLNREAKKYDLRVSADLHNYKVRDSKTGSIIDEFQSAEEVACYFRGLEIAKRFKK